MPLSGVAPSACQDTGNQSQQYCLHIPRNPTVTNSTDRRISSQATALEPAIQQNACEGGHSCAGRGQGPEYIWGSCCCAPTRRFRPVSQKQCIRIKYLPVKIDIRQPTPYIFNRPYCRLTKTPAPLIEISCQKRCTVVAMALAVLNNVSVARRPLAGPSFWSRPGT